MLLLRGNISIGMGFKSSGMDRNLKVGMEVGGGGRAKFNLSLWRI